MSLQSAVFDILLEKGPLLPAEIVREVNVRTGQSTDMFFVGAILSEYMSSRKIRMSNAKVGGSKLYYCPGQEPKLVKLYDHLHEKEKKAYDLLKENKVLRESSLEPVIRVAIKDLKDFAVPIDVKVNDNETFWKWFLTPMDEAQNLIREVMKDEIEFAKKARETQKKEAEVRKEEREKELQSHIQNSNPSQFFDTKVKNVETVDLGKNSDSGFILGSGSSGLKIPKPKDLVAEKKEIKKEVVKETVSSPVKKTKKESGMLKPLNSEHQSKLTSDDGSDDADVIDDPYMLKLISFFEKKGIDVLDSNLLKKNNDCEFNVLIDSQFGKLHYYVYSKNKSKISETDLAYAYVRAQNKNLPLCFISSGSLTKKAEQSLDSDLKAASFMKL